MLKGDLNVYYLVASVNFGDPGQSPVEHAMVLDTFDTTREVFIFKNTYDDPENGQPRRIEIHRTDQNAPEELYFVHIEIRDMAKLPSQSKRRKAKLRHKSKLFFQ